MKQLHRTIIKKQAALMRRLIPHISGLSRADRREHRNHGHGRYRPLALKGQLSGLTDNKLARVLRAVVSEEELFRSREKPVWLNDYTTKVVLISVFDEDWYMHQVFQSNTVDILHKFHYK